MSEITNKKVEEIYDEISNKWKLNVFNQNLKRCE